MFFFLAFLSNFVASRNEQKRNNVSEVRKITEIHNIAPLTEPSSDRTVLQSSDYDGAASL